MIMNNWRFLCLPAVVVVLFLSTCVASLKCVQCVSCAHNIPEATECSVSPEKSSKDKDFPTCMKTVTKFSDREVISRQCSPAPFDTEPFCSEIKNVEHCIYHCQSDGCNGASGTTSGGKVASWLAVLICLTLRFLYV